MFHNILGVNPQQSHNSFGFRFLDVALYQRRETAKKALGLKRQIFIDAHAAKHFAREMVHQRQITITLGIDAKTNQIGIGREGNGDNTGIGCPNFFNF